MGVLRPLRIPKMATSVASSPFNADRRSAFFSVSSAFDQRSISISGCLRVSLADLRGPCSAPETKNTWPIKTKCFLFESGFAMERALRIELLIGAWKAPVLPLHYTRLYWSMLPHGLDACQIRNLVGAHRCKPTSFGNGYYITTRVKLVQYKQEHNAANLASTTHSVVFTHKKEFVCHVLQSQRNCTSRWLA